MPQQPVVRPSGCPRAVWPLCCSQVQAGVLEPALASAGRLGADRPRAIRRVLLPVGLVRGAPRLSPPPPPLPLPSMPSLPLVSGLQPSPLRLRPSPPVSVPLSLPPSSLARQPPLPAPNPNPTSGPAPLSRKLGVARSLRVAAALVRSATHHNPSPEPEPEPEDPRHCPPPGRRAGVCRSRAHYYNYYYIKPSWSMQTTPPLPLTLTLTLALALTCRWRSRARTTSPFGCCSRSTRSARSPPPMDTPPTRPHV